MYLSFMVKKNFFLDDFKQFLDALIVENVQLFNKKILQA